MGETSKVKKQSKKRKMPRGYGMVQTLAMQQPGVTMQAKALYSLLASYTGSTEFCFPSVAKLAQDFETSKKTIIRYLKELVDNGLIQKRRLYPNNPMRHNNKYYVMYIEDELEVTLEDESEVTPGDYLEGSIGGNPEVTLEGNLDVTSNSNILNSNILNNNTKTDNDKAPNESNLTLTTSKEEDYKLDQNDTVESDKVDTIPDIPKCHYGLDTQDGNNTGMSKQDPIDKLNNKDTHTDTVNHDIVQETVPENPTQSDDQPNNNIDNEVPYNEEKEPMFHKEKSYKTMPEPDVHSDNDGDYDWLKPKLMDKPKFSNQDECENNLYDIEFDEIAEFESAQSIPILIPQQGFI